MSTAKGLSAWRAASRDVAHAEEALTTAELAHVTAGRAEQAAQETADLARVAGEAAVQAEASAKATAEATGLTLEQADTDLADRRARLEAAKAGERVAQERHRELQDSAYERHGLIQTHGADPEPTRLD